MKGKTQIFAVLSILFLLLISPQNSTANQKANRSELYSQFSASGKFSFNFLLHYQRILKDGVWWIYVYDGAKLIDTYPE